MTTEHKDIADVNRHEPKGASTASAGEVYVSDGNGGGSWKSMTGWETHLDGEFTVGSPESISSGVRTKLTIDGTSFQSGQGLSTWDTSTSTMNPEGVNYCYHIRFDFKASTSGTNAYIDIEFDGGPTLGVFLTESKRVEKGGSLTNNIVISTEVFVDADLAADGLTFYGTPSANMDIWDIGIFIVRSHLAY